MDNPYRSGALPQPLARRTSLADLVFVSRPRAVGALVVVEEWTYGLAGGRVQALRAVERVCRAGAWAEGRDLDVDAGAPPEVLVLLGAALARAASEQSGVHRLGR